MTDTVRFDIQGAVGVITLDRPPVNAINADLVADLGEAIDAASDPAVRAVVVVAPGRGDQYSRLDRPVARGGPMARRPGVGIHETAGAATGFASCRACRCGESVPGHHR